MQCKTKCLGQARLQPAFGADLLGWLGQPSSNLGPHVHQPTVPHQCRPNRYESNKLHTLPHICKAIKKLHVKLAQSLKVCLLITQM